MPDLDAKTAAYRIIARLNLHGHRAMLAGGCVRDMLMGAIPKDYDVATDATPDVVISLFSRTDKVGAQFGVVLVRQGRHQVEVATFRSDLDYSDGRHPDAVRFGNELDDALRRDFTINGMFYDVSDERVIDHVGGRQDLDAKLICAIGDPDRRFAEDHLRMLRAVRFAARLDFAIEPVTLQAIQRQAPSLAAICPERIREELRMILCERPAIRARGWRLIAETRLADYIIPGLQWSDTLWHDAGQRLAYLPDAPSLMLVLSAVLLGREPHAAESACRRLRCNNIEARGAAWLLESLPFVQDPDQLEMADLKLLMADPRFPDLLSLLRAHTLAQAIPTTACDALAARARDIPPADVAPLPFVTGDDLLDRGVPQGPAYARILDGIYRAQLNHRVTTRDQALAMLDDHVAPRDP